MAQDQKIPGSGDARFAYEFGQIKQRLKNLESPARPTNLRVAGVFSDLDTVPDNPEWYLQGATRSISTNASGQGTVAWDLAFDTDCIVATASVVNGGVGTNTDHTVTIQSWDASGVNVIVTRNNPSGNGFVAFNGTIRINVIGLGY